MWLTRYVLPLAVAIATLLACLAPGKDSPPATISARELLARAQTAGGAHYTFSRDTAARLSATEVARPAEGAGLAQLEASLRAAGFELAPERHAVRVEALPVEPAGR